KGSVYQYNADGNPVFQKVVSPPPKGSPPSTPDTVTTIGRASCRASDGKWVPTGGSDNDHGDFTISNDWAAGTSTTRYTTTDLTVVTGADGHTVSETGTDDNGHYFTTFTATGSTTTYDSGKAKGSVYQYNVDGDPVFQKVVSAPPKGSPPGTPDTVT